MKKIGLFLMLVVFFNTAKTQTLYSTFTDSIRFDLGGGMVSNYSIISSPLNESYAVIAKYDNTLYGMLFYYAKLNVDGNIVMDTVYSITPESSMAYPTIYSQDYYQNNISLWSNFENSDYKNQPFILNFNENGSINWMKYYEIDTLNFEIRGGFVTNDGSHITHGFVSNWNNINYGFILKTDPTGNVVWNRFYGFKYSLAVPSWNGVIKKMTQTEDGGYLIAQEITDDTYSLVYPLFVKLNANGDVEWTKSFEFLSPIDNAQDGGTNITGLVSVDATNVIATMTVNDTLNGTRNTFMISFNPSNGNVNWDKLLRLPSMDFDINSLFKIKDATLGGYYYDSNYGTVLVKWNKSYGISKIVQNRELPLGVNYPGIFNVDAAYDGGLIYSTDMYSYTGMMIFKTDKDFSTNCPYTEFLTLPLEESITYNYLSILDTNYFTPINAIDATLETPQTYNQQVADPYCACNIELAGFVTTAVSTPESSANVYLYRIGENGKLVYIDSTQTDASGYYSFQYLQFGEYVVKSTPSALSALNYLPTYFNLVTPSTQWETAELIYKDCFVNPFNFNIDLVAKLTQTGSWQCSGYVFELAGYGNRLSSTNSYQIMAPGDPLSDIDITIDQSPGGAISSATTDVNGFFHFTGLNNNATFILRADLPGFPNDSIYTFTVNPGDGALDSLNFYIGSDSVYILPQGLVGINVFETKDFNLDIIPNPTKDNFVLELTSLKKASAELILTSSIGTHVLNKKVDLNVGVNKVDFDFNNQPAGIYFMIINIGNEHYFRKIVKQ